MLEDHEPDTNPHTLLHVLGEHGLPGAQTATGGQLLLSLLVKDDSSLNLEELGAQHRVIDRKTAQLAQGGQALFVAVLHGEPTRREGQEEHADKEDPGEDDLEGDGETPGNVLKRMSVFSDLILCMYR